MARGYRGGITKRLTRRQRNGVGQNQTQTLVAYIEQHNLFARGQVPRLGPQGHIKYQQMWSALAATLNEMGPSIRDVQAWQRYWTQLTLSAKSTKARFLTELNRTGHTAPEQTLNEIDERICNIFGSYRTGINIGSESDLPDSVTEFAEAVLNAFNIHEIGLPRIAGILSTLQENLRSVLQNR